MYSVEANDGELKYGVDNVIPAMPARPHKMFEPARCNARTDRLELDALYCSRSYLAISFFS